MTRAEAIAEIEAAGGFPSNSAWLKYSIPERSKTFCRFPSKFYGDMEPGTLRREVEEYRRMALRAVEISGPNPLDGVRLWDNS